MKIPAGNVSQKGFRGALKGISKGGTYSSSINKSFKTVGGGKYRGLFYKGKVSRQQGTAFIDDYKKESGLASINKESAERTFNRALGKQAKEIREQKVEDQKGQRRQEHMVKELFSWRKQGDEKQGLNITDLRKKFSAAGTGAAAGKTAATKPGGTAAKLVPRGGADIHSLPRLYRRSSPESLEAHPRGLSEIQPDKPTPAKEKAKPTAEPPAPAESKSASSGGTDDMMLD